MADEVALPSKLACFFHTLICARGCATCTRDQDSDFPVSRDSQAPSPGTTKAVAARSKESEPKWSSREPPLRSSCPSWLSWFSPAAQSELSIAVNLSYSADKGTGNKCPTVLSPGTISGEVDDYLYFPTSFSSVPPVLLPTIEDHSPDTEHDMVWPSHPVSYFLAAVPAPQGEVRPSSMHIPSTRSSWELSNRPASLEILGANRQDKALGGTVCQLLPASPTFLHPRGSRKNMQASTLTASKQSHVKGLLVDQGARTLSTWQHVAGGNGLYVQNSGSAFSQDSKYGRASASMVHQGRPELGQGVGIRSHNSVTVDSRSSPIFRRQSMDTGNTFMQHGADAFKRRGLSYRGVGVCPPQVCAHIHKHGNANPLSSLVYKVVAWAGDLSC
eukprot:gene9202-16341_t